MKVQSEFDGPVEDHQSNITTNVSGYVYFEESRAQKLSRQEETHSQQLTEQQEEEIVSNNNNVAYSQQSSSNDLRGRRRQSSANSSSPTKYVSPYKQTKVVKKTTTKRTMVSSQVPDMPPMPV